MNHNHELEKSYLLLKIQQNYESLAQGPIKAERLERLKPLSYDDLLELTHELECLDPLAIVRTNADLLVDCKIVAKNISSKANDESKRSGYSVGLSGEF